MSSSRRSKRWPMTSWMKWTLFSSDSGSTEPTGSTCPSWSRVACAGRYWTRMKKPFVATVASRSCIWVVWDRMQTVNATSARKSSRSKRSTVLKEVPWKATLKVNRMRQLRTNKRMKCIEMWSVRKLRNKNGQCILAFKMKRLHIV